MNNIMKKSLILLAGMLFTLGASAQDDDVYFVPSSKTQTSTAEVYSGSHSSYTPLGSTGETPSATDDNGAFESSDWCAHRGNGSWDVDAYNRRGRNYKGQCYADTTKAEKQGRTAYDEGYDDGYEDGYFTSRLVRFWSPRLGVYVSSPYYMDYYDFCYDPWYYGYASPWYGWGWSGWWGWGSWYGWRPWHSGWYGWGWGGWYDPWWGGPSYAWYPHHWGGGFMPSNAQRGPVGGFVAYGGRRGTGAVGGNSTGRSGFRSGSRPSLGYGSMSNRTTGGRTNYGSATRPSRNFGNSNTTQRQSNSRSTTARPSQQSGQSNRSFGNSSAPSRSYNSSPSRSGGSFSGGGGGGRSFGGGGGGGRSFGGRR